MTTTLLRKVCRNISSQKDCTCLPKSEKFHHANSFSPFPSAPLLPLVSLLLPQHTPYLAAFYTFPDGAAKRGVAEDAGAARLRYTGGPAPLRPAPRATPLPALPRPASPLRARPKGQGGPGGWCWSGDGEGSGGEGVSDRAGEALGRVGTRGAAARGDRSHSSRGRRQQSAHCLQQVTSRGRAAPPQRGRGTWRPWGGRRDPGGEGRGVAQVRFSQLAAQGCGGRLWGRPGLAGWRWAPVLSLLSLTFSKMGPWSGPGDVPTSPQRRLCRGGLREL